MSWLNKIKYPGFCGPHLINKEVFEDFIDHFGLTKTFDRVLRGRTFYNPAHFMDGSRYYNNGRYDQFLFPLECDSFDHVYAYKDNDDHVLVVSQPYGIYEEEILKVMQDNGWVAIICDPSKAFYCNTTDVFYVTTKETYEYFNSDGYFDGWGIKVLQ